MVDIHTLLQEFPVKTRYYSNNNSRGPKSRCRIRWITTASSSNNLAKEKCLRLSSKLKLNSTILEPTSPTRWLKLPDTAQFKEGRAAQRGHLVLKLLLKRNKRNHSRICGLLRSKRSLRRPLTGILNSQNSRMKRF